MRAHEFLLEYDRSKAMAAFGGRLQDRLNKDPDAKNLSINDLFDRFERQIQVQINNMFPG